MIYLRRILGGIIFLLLYPIISLITLLNIVFLWPIIGVLSGMNGIEKNMDFVEENIWHLPFIIEDKIFGQCEY